MTDTPICAFGMADGSLCMDERLVTRCRAHQDLVCHACRAHEATHECHCDNGTMLCENCIHISERQHGPRPNPRDVVEEEMSRTIELILEQLNATEELPSTAPQRRAAAVQLWRGLSSHVALKVMAGMARPESETP